MLANRLALSAVESLPEDGAGASVGGRTAGGGGGGGAPPPEGGAGVAPVRSEP